MISDERKEELQFLIRNGTPIRMTDEVQSREHTTRIPYTEIDVDFSDLYTLRDLCEADIISFDRLKTDINGDHIVTTTFYESVKIANDTGELMSILEMETIDIAIEHKIIEDIRNYIGN